MQRDKPMGFLHPFNEYFAEPKLDILALLVCNSGDDLFCSDSSPEEALEKAKYKHSRRTDFLSKKM